MGIKIKITNVNAVVNKIKNHSEVIQAALQKELDRFAIKTVAGAKRRCPVDEGFLRNSINFKSEPLKVSIVVSAFYAAYVEFGTRNFAAQEVSKLSPDWQEFALRYKTSNGGFGMRAQPYLRPSIENEVVELQKRLNAL